MSSKQVLMSVIVRLAAVLGYACGVFAAVRAMAVVKFGRRGAWGILC